MPDTSSGMFDFVRCLIHESFNMHHSPETIESLFLAFRLTGNPKYRDDGWAIFQAIEKHCRIPTGGYASIINVDQVPAVHDDKMETFLLVRNVPWFCEMITFHLSFLLRVKH
jgi:hypothetical protein